jgi:drug/metabolite transporter (DMT)-like permease
LPLRHFIELLALAALWGASFLFMRLGAGEFGPTALAALRVALGAAVLLPFVAWHGLLPELLRHWRQIALLGVINSALPFLAYAYAALSITAGLSSIFNATTPLWGGLIAWLWLNQRPGSARLIGLAIGFAGVLWLVWDKAGFKSGAAGGASVWPVLACIGATLLYGISANVTRRYLSHVTPMVMAAGSQLGATLALAVPGILWWPAQLPGSTSWLSVLALGLACTGLAYLLYFRLINHAGATPAMSVTFVIPLFAVLWGWVFLDESITGVMLGACAVIVLGTTLASGLWEPRWLRARTHG